MEYRSITDEYVPDRWAGGSLGLEYKFRLIEYKGHHVIFDYMTGRIMECIVNQKYEHLTKDYANKRLFEVNGLEMKVDAEMRRALDETN
jgi:hypothetical protein